MSKSTNEDNHNDESYKKLLEENIKLKKIIVRIKECLETSNLNQ